MSDWMKGWIRISEGWIRNRCIGSRNGDALSCTGETGRGPGIPYDTGVRAKTGGALFTGENGLHAHEAKEGGGDDESLEVKPDHEKEGMYEGDRR